LRHAGRLAKIYPGPTKEEGGGGGFQKDAPLWDPYNREEFKAGPGPTLPHLRINNTLTVEKKKKSDSPTLGKLWHEKKGKGRKKDLGGEAKRKRNPKGYRLSIPTREPI